MPSRDRISRRQFLRRSAAGAVAAGAGALLGFGGYEKVHGSRAAMKSNYAVPSPVASAAPTATATPVPQRYSALHSRPDLNSAPTLHITETSGTPAPGYVFLTPSEPSPQGCAMFDTAGHLVWYRPGTAAHTLNLNVQQFDGNDVAVWFEGDVDDAGTGRGAYLMFDQHYQQLMRVTGGGGTPLDLHEFQVTDSETALVEFYEPVPGDTGATVLSCVVQEIDLPSGKTLFEWRSLDHVAVAESVQTAPSSPGANFDYFHINSIDVDSDNTLIVSARNTSSLYKVDRSNGNVIWRLRGSDYPPVPDPRIKLAPAGESFWFQHDARRNGDATLSMFDDGGGPYHHNGRGLIIRVDESAGTANVERQYGSDLGIHVDYQGSFRMLPNGNAFIGWGDVGRVTEFHPDGSVCFDATFSGNSYRAVRAEWTGIPLDPPALAAGRDASGAHLWASWNGSTEVRKWRVLGGADANSLRMLTVEPWQDFETTLDLREPLATYAVEALDEHGKSFARSPVVSFA